MLLLPLSCPATEVVYHGYPEDQQHRIRYEVALLQLALGKSEKTYRLRPSSTTPLQKRALRSLERNQGLDVIWTMTSRERERQLQPIRIPIYKGLVGWRVLLVKENQVQRFHRLESEAQLKALTAVQMHDWPDVDILNSNGYRVAVSPSYNGMFKMLANGHIDYFPRAAQEISTDIQAHASLGLAIEESLVLYYPTATYFFVRRDADELAGDLRAGLEKAIASGEFDALFNRHFGSRLGYLKLGERKKFILNNPLLPPATPIERTDLWYRPE